MRLYFLECDKEGNQTGVEYLIHEAKHIPDSKDFITPFNWDGFKKPIYSVVFRRFIYTHGVVSQINVAIKPYDT